MSLSEEICGIACIDVFPNLGDAFKMLGERLVKNMVSNLLFIGTVNAPAPIYHRNVLKNFIPFKVHASEYHRTYPYRATQWYFADGK